MPAMFPYTPCPVTGMRAATTSRGFGSPLRSACAAAGLSSTLSISPPTLDHVNPLLMASDATDGCSGPISAGTSALAALEAANPVAHVPAPAAAPVAPVAPAVAVPVPEAADAADKQDAYDARMYVDATVKDVSRSLDRKNYRMTLRLEGGEKVLSMRIGDTEGASLSSLLKQSNTSRCGPCADAPDGVQKRPLPHVLLRLYGCLFAVLLHDGFPLTRVVTLCQLLHILSFGVLALGIVACLRCSPALVGHADPAVSDLVC